MAFPVARERLLQLYKLRASIFNTTFNPSNVRTGNKYLRQRLKGKSLADYYPPRTVTVADMRRIWPELGFIDEQEQARVDAVERAKARGKGAPKKIRVKPDKPTKKKK
ncbi:mitochondrial ribosomal subunit S27-domain-containing protein [Sphaerosporella brunnea]|uniref:Small ribosomal subunit protein mS33 n=1 Tax=Sphaerosporella brunnea TaxID=1250544 RepID=A0A5J5F4G1_9PEZI|nr:mitochondrial ribosomal subunit S27-domain-containing protein [Sphaerosporella brunnea]KAA8911344.1 mitochondrial ribosomal subunit S27-domain-containing protein [Sphaerosporella brunnea]